MTFAMPFAGIDIGLLGVAFAGLPSIFIPQIVISFLELLNIDS